jgi:hypothetical protein
MNASRSSSVTNRTNLSPSRPSSFSCLCHRSLLFHLVQSILKRLKREGDASIVVIDARADNKPSGSNA